MYEKALLHFRKVDTILFEIASKQEPFVLSVAPNYFIRLTRAIIGQQLSVKVANVIYTRFEKLFKNRINAKELLEIPDVKIRECGISFPKIKYLKDLALKVHTKELVLKDFETETNEIIIEKLTQVKGIGIWSAEMFMMGALARPDVFSFGDLGLKNAIKKHYKIENLTLQKMTDLSKIWSPFRTYAARILWNSLNNEPK